MNIPTGLVLGGLLGGQYNIVQEVQLRKDSLTDKDKESAIKKTRTRR
jgi:hypothetical protein